MQGCAVQMELLRHEHLLSRLLWLEFCCIQLDMAALAAMLHDGDRG